MRHAQEFIVAAGRRKPFRLTAKRGDYTVATVAPIVRGRVRLPVQGLFRGAVEELVLLGAVLIPNGGEFPDKIEENEDEE